MIGATTADSREQMRQEGSKEKMYATDVSDDGGRIGVARREEGLGRA